MSIQVEIVAPDKNLFSGEVDIVTIPGRDGQLGIMGGHAPLISTLDIGEITLNVNGDMEYVAVSGGVVEVRPDKVTILAESAEAAGEIDEQRAREALERARKSLEETPPSEAQHREAMLTAVRRSNLRLKVAQRRSRSRRTGAGMNMGGGAES